MAMMRSAWGPGVASVSIGTTSAVGSVAVVGPLRNVALVFAAAAFPVSSGSVVHPDSTVPNTNRRTPTKTVDAADREGVAT